MFQKDNIIVGIGLGLVIPFVGYALLLTLFEQLEGVGLMSPENMSSNFRLRTVALVAIALNLIPLAIYNKKRFIDTMRGFVFPTLLYVIAWFMIYGRHLIGS